MPTGDSTSSAAPTSDRLRTVQLIAPPPPKEIVPAFRTRRRGAALCSSISPSPHVTMEHRHSVRTGPRDRFHHLEQRTQGAVEPSGNAPLRPCVRLPPLPEPHMNRNRRALGQTHLPL